ncbi:hypothetical protein Tco_0599024 [Tanacetum coccineum]
MVNAHDPSLFAAVEHLRHVNIDLAVKDNMPDLLSDIVKKKRRRTELPKLKAPTDVTDKPILKVVKYHEILKETNGFAPPTTLYFDEHVRHGKTIIGLAWEMYIESFLDPTLALKNRDTTEGLT